MEEAVGYRDMSKEAARPGRPLQGTINGLKYTVQHENEQRGMALGPIERITMHWSVGTYAMAFDGYHYNIIFDQAKNQAHVIKTLKISEYGQHAFKANKSNIGVGFSAMFKTNPDTMQGMCPVTPEMMAVGAQFVAEFMAWHKLDPRTDDLTDHLRVDKEIGRNQKVDIGRLFLPFKEDVIRRYDALKAGKVKFQYKEILVD
jgi:hypothetical protein